MEQESMKKAGRGLLPALVAVVAVTGIVAALLSVRDRRPEKGPVAFYNDLVLKTTPVADQKDSPLCWIEAMLATIETDRLQLGDSVRLSPYYPARRFVEEQSVPCYFMRPAGGGSGDNEPGVTVRGTAMTALRLFSRYGLMPFDSYATGRNADWSALACEAAMMARSAASLAGLHRQLADMLDRQAGYLPPAVHMLGATYTPLELAHSLFLPSDYQALASCTHHPFYSRFALESPDNYYSDSCLNVPLDSMVAAVDRALARGRAVCWEGSIRHSGFDWKAGRADIAPIERRRMGTGLLQQRYRQRLIERHRVADEHAMCIIGRAHSHDGRRWYIVKNSWGETNGLKGYIYLSEDYFRLYTVVVVLRSDG